VQLALSHLHLALAAATGEVESPEGSGTGGVGVAVISIASIALGWIVLFALWWFVFRERRRPGRAGGAEQGESAEADRREQNPPV